MKKKLIPSFKTDKDIALFFDQQDTVNVLDETVPAQITFPQPKHKVIISLNDNEWRTLQRKATRKKIPYTRLLETMIHTQLLTQTN